MLACDGLCTRPLDPTSLRDFLRTYFAVPDSEIFVSSDDLVDDALRDDPRDNPFTVFCTHGPVEGDFAATFSISANPPLPTQVSLDPRKFAAALAAHTACDILCGFGDEPQPWLWTLTRPDGASLPAHLDEDSDRGPTCPCEHLHRKVLYLPPLSTRFELT
ncbi:hypothetical protein ACRS6B_08650 [Nocardia asteroides]